MYNSGEYKKFIKMNSWVMSTLYRLKLTGGKCAYISFNEIDLYNKEMNSMIVARTIYILFKLSLISKDTNTNYQMYKISVDNGFK